MPTNIETGQQAMNRGAELRALRLRRGLSQGELGDILCGHVETKKARSMAVSRWECKGCPVMVLRLAQLELGEAVPARTADMIKAKETAQ